MANRAKTTVNVWAHKALYAVVVHASLYYIKIKNSKIYFLEIKHIFLLIKMCDRQILSYTSLRMQYDYFIWLLN